MAYTSAIIGFAEELFLLCKSNDSTAFPWGLAWTQTTNYKWRPPFSNYPFVLQGWSWPQVRGVGFPAAGLPTWKDSPSDSWTFTPPLPASFVIAIHHWEISLSWWGHERHIDYSKGQFTILYSVLFSSYKGQIRQGDLPSCLWGWFQGTDSPTTWDLMSMCIRECMRVCILTFWHFPAYHL